MRITIEVIQAHERSLQRLLKKEKNLLESLAVIQKHIKIQSEELEINKLNLKTTRS